MSDKKPHRHCNRLIQSLARVCQERMYEEKWLIAPTLRVGRQWLDSVTFAGQPVLNVRVTTLYQFARKIAAPSLVSLGREPVTQISTLIHLDRVWSSLADSRDPYITDLHPSLNLFQTLAAAIQSLRLADVAAKDLITSSFEIPRKGSELKRFLAGYESELETSGHADIADVYRAADERIRTNPQDLSETMLLLIPEDLDLTVLESRYLESVSESQRISLVVDPPWNRTIHRDPKPEPDSGQAGLFPMQESEEVPQDLQMQYFHSIGEGSEVREVLRRILSSGVALDQVEILHPDRETYVSLLFETTQTLACGEEFPITFEEGIPVSFSKPGRAFSLWLRWITEGHPQSLFVELVREGLLQFTNTEADPIPNRFLAEVFQNIRIGHRLDRYLPKVDEAISSIQTSLDAPPNISEEDGGERAAFFRKDRENQLKTLLSVQSRLTDLVELSRPSNSGERPADTLRRAQRFLQEFAVASGEVDRYAAKALTDKIDLFRSALAEEKQNLNIDIWNWLIELPESVPMLGSRPRPGHLHVAPLALGGHSGRPITYILGLDDGRIPGVSLQDPILLDSERRKISHRLATTAQRLEKKIQEYWKLLGRLRGVVTLSFPSRDIVEDREKFPSPLLLETYRKDSGKLDENQSDFIKGLPVPASFSPTDPEDSLDLREWWLSLLTDENSPRDPDPLLALVHPHLSKGREAQVGRDSEEFTIFDGRVSPGLLTNSPDNLGPFGAEGAVLSATSLEEMGRCPLAYFFRKMLGISPPGDLKQEPGVWLGPLEAGSLLHEVFHEFVAGCIERKESVSIEMHEEILSRILERRIAYYSKIEPPPDESTFTRQAEEFRLTTRLFLKEEEILSRHYEPISVETGFGFGESSKPHEEPIEIKLDENRSIRVRGRIDRIDRMRKEEFALWDYKTGGTKRYRTNPPFNQGRIIQPFLYWAIAREILRIEMGPDSKVASFGYFFPTGKGMTDRIVHDADQLESGRQVALDLCLLLDTGAFVPTNHKEDCRYCDFNSICGDIDRVAENSTRKLENESNLDLDPFRELRDIDAG